PGIVFAALRNSGDLTVATSLSFTMNGSTTAVPMTLTTGVAAAAGMVVEGMPIASDGRFALVGITADSGLGPPLGGALLAVRLACQAVPRPDTDQFRLATRTTPVSATLTARALILRAIFAPGTMDVPDFPASPALLRASSGDATITTVDLPSGLPARGRKLFIGRSDDGRAALGVRRLQRSGRQCPPGCPMHARRLGCHHGAAMRCHRSGSSNAIRTACSQAPDRATPASEGMRGVIPAPARLAAAFTPRSTTQRARVLVTQHVPEPASHPPKLLA